MGRQEKNLITRMTDKAMENDLRNHIGEIDLLNKNLDNLREFISTIKFNDKETKSTIATYNRAINIYDHIANKFATLKHQLDLYEIYFKTYNVESLRPLLIEYKKKCKNLSSRIDKLELGEIDILFNRTNGSNCNL
ncbi:MAG: hypothetical protein IKC49_00165 [Clostridia bacterium]|nr:hypothetical protein [Clostridia bacterium]